MGYFMYLTAQVYTNLLQAEQVSVSMRVFRREFIRKAIRVSFLDDFNVVKEVFSASLFQ